jgi:hypothetical protein
MKMEKERRMMIAFTAASTAFFVVGLIAFLLTLAPEIQTKNVHVKVLEIASGKSWEFDATKRGDDCTYGGIISYPFFSTGLQIGFGNGPVVISGSYQIDESEPKPGN